MSLKVKVSKPHDEKWTIVDLDESSLMFFDTLLAALNCAGDRAEGLADAEEDSYHSRIPQENSRIILMRMDYATNDKQGNEQYDYFEYYDEDEDTIAVRNDDELNSFLSACREAIQNDEILRVRLKSSKFTSINLGNHLADDDLDEENDEACQIRPENLHFIEKLSEGQFGTVYRALNTKSDEYLAVKSISLDGAMNSRSSILNEIEILRIACASPYIVDFYSAIFVDSELLICLELMDGLSLDRYGKLAPPILGGVTVAIVRGLAYLWSKNIMHRDIKPNNILVNRRGDVKLSDFGVSKQMAQSVAWSYVGTKVYMAPERINGNLYKIHSDIWSLGISLLEMALGRFPFSDITSKSINLNKMIEFIHESNAILESIITSAEILPHGPAFRQLISECLRNNPFERIRPQELVDSEFIHKNTPIRHEQIAKFVSEYFQKIK